MQVIFAGYAWNDDLARLDVAMAIIGGFVLLSLIMK